MIFNIFLCKHCYHALREQSQTCQFHRGSHFYSILHAQDQALPTPLLASGSDGQSRLLTNLIAQYAFQVKRNLTYLSLQSVWHALHARPF